VALRDCLQWMASRSILRDSPLKDHVAAVSCGVVGGEAVIDLDYAEDSTAHTDANFVMTGAGGLVEVQGSAEGAPFTEAELMNMLTLARTGIGRLVALQKAAIA
jgi:ribonuclease PH